MATEEKPKSEIVSIIERTNSKPISFPNIVSKVNQKNSKIESFSCDDVTIKIWRKNFAFKLRGSLFYEKPKNFRMNFYSVLGKELDLGSNKQHFWYWSRRDSYRALYYAKHEDFVQTRLKTPFNPMFLQKSLGLSQLAIEENEIVETEEQFLVTYNQKGSRGRTSLYSIIINKEHNRIEGTFITKKGELVASSEIKEFDQNLPRKILYTWHKENKSLLIEFENPVSNERIDSQLWKMPDLNSKVNMANE